MAGKYPISLKLSEEVPASFTLIVKGDQVIQEPQTQTVVIEENFDQKQSEQAENVVKSPSEMNTDTNETRTKLQEEVEDRTKN